MLPLGLILGGAQIIAGAIQGGKAKKATAAAQAAHNAIPQVDPGVAALVNEFDARQKYAEAGNSRMLGVKRNMIDDTTEQGMANMRRATGSAPGTALIGITRLANAGARNKAIAGAETEQLGMKWAAMKGPYISDMADRSLAHKQYSRDLLAFQGAQHQTNANNLIMGGAAHAANSLMGTEIGGGEKSMPDGGGALGMMDANKFSDIGMPDGAGDLGTSIDPGMGAGLFAGSKFFKPGGDFGF
jgi:hypothetical protein